MSKRRKKKIRINSKDYEGYRFGPLKLEQIGRLVQISSEWKPDQFKEHLKRLKDSRPRLKEEIDKKINKLMSIIGQYDPFQLLAVISAKNCFADPEQYAETTHEGRECYVEYAQSMVLGRKRKSTLQDAPVEAIEQFNRLVAEVFKDVTWYFVSEAAEEKFGKTEQELRFDMITEYLFVRGDSYPEHHLDMIRDIFQEHDVFLERHYGFKIGEVIDRAQCITDQVLENVRQRAKLASLINDLHKQFKEFVANAPPDSISSLDDCKKEYHSKPIVKERMKELEKLRVSIDKNPFEIAPSEEIPVEFLELLSSRLGDNTEFLAFERTSGWPTNDTIIYRKPLIEDDGKFYCFSPQVLFRNIDGILETWIQQEDNEYYLNVFQKKKSEYLERKSLEYLRRIFPKADVYGGLFYYVEENGRRKRVETDGLIMYDENLLIIEAKAGSLSTSARRGSLERMKRDITELISKAHKQALRTKEYIMNNAEPVFEYEDGNTAVVISGRDKYKSIYLINITLQNLGEMSTHLSSLKRLKLIQGREWPWSVFINDLKVISELVEFPSEFLLFLQRRIRANDYPQFRAMDELDFLMFFFSQGLYLENGDLENCDTFMPHGYTEELDRYYDYIAGRVSSGEKPRLKMPEEYKNFVSKIELAGKEGFTRVATTILSFDGKTQQRILEALDEIKSLSRDNGGNHNFTLHFNTLNLGVTFYVCGKHEIDFWEEIDQYCAVKMYQTRFREWMVITMDLNENEKLDFRIYDKEWEPNPDLEKQLTGFKDWKIVDFESTCQKIGRNDPCPCGSGLKYKKCCLERRRR